MPSVSYMNQSAPFWDFVASLEQQGQAHPFFSQNTNNKAARPADEGHPFGPFGWGYPPGFPFRGPPPHARRHDHHDHPVRKGNDEKATDKVDDDNVNDNGEGPSNISGNESERRGRHGRCRAGNRGHCGEEGTDKEQDPSQQSGNEQEGFGRHRGRHGHCGAGRRYDCQAKETDNEKAEGESDKSGSESEGCGRHKGRHDHCGGGRRGRGHHGFGPHGHAGPHGHPWAHGSHHGGPRHGGRGGGRGPWGRRGGPFGGGFFDPLAFVSGLFDASTTPNNTPANNTAAANEAEIQDFAPEADVFDTPSSFVIHVSLPGAKKEDVGVNWDPEKSELSIAGVIYRPGDEEFLKTLAMDERKVGPFERKIRLGTTANPAKIDAEGISAKLEDGVLRIEVPKLGMEDFVEVKKVDIE